MRPLASRVLVTSALCVVAVAVGCGSSSSDFGSAAGGNAGSRASAGSSSLAGAPTAHAGAPGHDSAGQGGDTSDDDGSFAGVAPADGGAAGHGAAGASQGGASGNAGSGGSSATSDPKCKDFDSLTVSDFELIAAAGPSQSALFTAKLHNLTDEFVDYTGGILTCQEEGTWVDSVSTPNWSFGIAPKGTQILGLSAKLSATAMSGATIHCTVHAALLNVPECANTSTASLEFKVK